MTADAPTHDEMLATAAGLDLAVVIANKAGIITTPEMTPEKAADLARNVIASALLEHANAIRRSAFQREREQPEEQHHDR